MASNGEFIICHFNDAYHIEQEGAQEPVGGSARYEASRPPSSTWSLPSVGPPSRDPTSDPVAECLGIPSVECERNVRILRP